MTLNSIQCHRYLRNARRDHPSLQTFQASPVTLSLPRGAADLLACPIVHPAQWFFRFLLCTTIPRNFAFPRKFIGFRTSDFFRISDFALRIWLRCLRGLILLRGLRALPVKKEICHSRSFTIV